MLAAFEKTPKKNQQLHYTTEILGTESRCNEPLYFVDIIYNVAIIYNVINETNLHSVKNLPLP